MIDLLTEFDEKVTQQALLPESERSLTEEGIFETSRALALEKGYTFEKTDPLSQDEMFENEENAVFGALIERTGQAVPRTVTQLTPYSPEMAVHPSTGSRFLVWMEKVDPPHAPKELSEGNVREQVRQAWLAGRARELARERAEELAEKANEKAKSEGGSGVLGDLVSGQSMTGADDDERPLALRETGPITQIDPTSVMSPNPFNQQPPRRTNVAALLDAEAPLGDEFFETVFDELEPGEAAVTTDSEGKAYYVVHVDPGAGDEIDRSVLSQEYFQLFSPYRMLAEQTKNRDGGNFRQTLFNEYGVTFSP